MVVQFLCPNGHKIHCEEERAGKPAKCPRCGVKFRIPELSQLAQSTDFAGQSEGCLPEESSTHDAPSLATTGSQIEFLCPNGHRLHGPRSMQGQPGQCPECGVPFRVPLLDGGPYEGETEAELGADLASSDHLAIPTGQSGVFVTPSRQDHGPVNPPSPPDPIPPVAGVPSALPVDDSDPPQPAGPVAHPLANLLSRLWAERAHGAVIELHLSDGQTIVPDRYAMEMSRGSIGVFALSESDGTHTVTAVAWDSVARVQVRRLRQLPDEFRL